MNAQLGSGKPVFPVKGTRLLPSMPALNLIHHLLYFIAIPQPTHKAFAQTLKSLQAAAAQTPDLGSFKHGVLLRLQPALHSPSWVLWKADLLLAPHRVPVLQPVPLQPLRWPV